MPQTQQIILGLLAVNLLTVFVFWLDKRRARRGSSRIPEKTLLWLAFLGGIAGALFARHVFRHKTRKEPFRTQLLAIACAYGVAAAVTLAFWLGPQQWREDLFFAGQTVFNSVRDGLR